MDKAKVKRFFLNVLALGTMALISISQVAYAETVSDETINDIDLSKIELTNNVFETKNGTLMCSLREISEALGFSVEWNADENSCVVAESVKYYIGEDKYICGEDLEAELGQAPELVDGLSYVPVDFFSSFFSLDISLNDEGAVILSEITDDAENEVINVTAGESFEVVLSENVSTGYQWTIEKDDAIELVSTEVITANTAEGLVGAPNDVCWTFKCDEPGEYTITFTYERNFQENSAVDVVEFNIVVE